MYTGVWIAGIHPVPVLPRAASTIVLTSQRVTGITRALTDTADTGPDIETVEANAYLQGAQVISSAETRQSVPVRHERIGNRRKIRVPGRLTWRDASGTLRFVSVTTRDVSEVDAFVECDVPASIPLYRLVHFQVERTARGTELPAVLQQGKVLSAVYRIGPYKTSTGTPQGYALRLLVEPKRNSAVAQEAMAAVN